MKLNIIPVIYNRSHLKAQNLVKIIQDQKHYYDDIYYSTNLEDILQLINTKNINFTIIINTIPSNLNDINLSDKFFKDC